MHTLRGAWAPQGGPAQWGLTRIQMRPRPWELGGSLIEGLCGQLGHESRFAWSFGPLVTNFHTPGPPFIQVCVVLRTAGQKLPYRISPGQSAYRALRGPSDRWTEICLFTHDPPSGAWNAGSGLGRLDSRVWAQDAGPACVCVSVAPFSARRHAGRLPRGSRAGLALPRSSMTSIDLDESTHRPC